MAGFDQRDSTSLERAREDYARDLNQPLAGLKVPAARILRRRPERRRGARAVDEAVAVLKKQGAVVYISLPNTELSIPAYYVIAPAEASTNLSRYDGVRYGHRAAGVQGL